MFEGVEMGVDSKLVAQMRSGVGSSVARNLRRGGVLPGVVSNEHGKSFSIQMNMHAFERMLHAHKSEHLILDLEIDGKTTKKVLLKDVQHHVVTGNPLHADFLEISMTKKMIVPISIKLIGDPIGVTRDGGVLDQLLRNIDIECLPADLVETIEVDVSGLELGKSILVSDITVGPKLAIVTARGIAVAAVTMPRSEEEEKAAEAAAAAAAGEVVADAAAPVADAAVAGKDAKATDAKGKAQEAKGKAPDAKAKGKG